MIHRTSADTSPKMCDYDNVDPKAKEHHDHKSKWNNNTLEFM